MLVLQVQCGGYFNSLAPGRFQFNFRKVIFKLTLVNGGWGISYEIALRWMPQDLTDDKSTLVRVMAWCRLATSHYLSQCWPRSMSPNGVTRPQWVNSLSLEKISPHFKNFILRFIHMNDRQLYHWKCIAMCSSGIYLWYINIAWVNGLMQHAII